MSRTVMRALTVAVFLAVIVVAGFKFFGQGEGIDRIELEDGEHDVKRAISVAGTQPITIRGYVFDGPGSFPLRLCDGRVEGSPPQCIGPWVSLENVDPAVFAFERGTDDGDPMHWQPDPVAIRGVLLGTQLTVEQVFN